MCIPAPFDFDKIFLCVYREIAEAGDIFPQKKSKKKKKKQFENLQFFPKCIRH